MKKIAWIITPYCLLLFLFFVAASAANAQDKPDLHRKIAPLQLQQDFILARDTLQKIHAGLYRYKSKLEINRLFDSKFALLKDSLDELAYFSIMRSLISGIEDGHTACFLPGELENPLFNSPKLFPIQPLFIGQRAYVACDTKEFPAGTEILAVDQQAIKELRRTLFGVIPSDGANETGKQVELNKFFFGHYAFALGERSSFTVDYKTPSGETKRKTLAGVAVNDIQCRPVNPKVEKYLQLNYQPGNIAVLTIQSFLNGYLEDTKENFKDFLAASFQELQVKKINKLIIDLRDNKGGEDENGALLYAYLTDKPFRYYDSLKSTTKNLQHPNLGLQQPKENNFTGSVAFLINGKCFSTTAEFCAVAKSNKRGVFIGEETGGGYYGNTSGDRATVILPNTKIRVNIPMNKYVLAVKKTRYKDRGIIPDYTIIPSIADLIQGKDVQMRYALKLAEKNY
jgi:Peptidase family S41